MDGRKVDENPCIPLFLKLKNPQVQNAPVGSIGHTLTYTHYITLNSALQVREKCIESALSNVENLLNDFIRKQSDLQLINQSVLVPVHSGHIATKVFCNVFP